MPQLIQQISIRAGMKTPDRLGLSRALPKGLLPEVPVPQEGALVWRQPSRDRVPGAGVVGGGGEMQALITY